MERKAAGPTAADMAIARDIEAFEAELGRRVPQPESVRGLRNSRFPERVGRIKPVFRISTVDGVVTVENPAGHTVLDQVNVRSATAMSGGE